MDCFLLPDCLSLQVREAQIAQYNYILVVGEEEVKTGQVLFISISLDYLSYPWTGLFWLIYMINKTENLLRDHQTTQVTSLSVSFSCELC